MLYQFFGVITPERAFLTLEYPKYKILHEDGSMSSLMFSINFNQIYVEYETQIEVTNIYTLRNDILTNIGQRLAIISYLKGIYYVIDLRRIVNRELSINEVLSVQIPYIENRRKDLDDFEKIYEKFMKISQTIDNLGQLQTYIKLCLHNLSLSMKLHLDTPFFCYRSIESLRNYCGKKYKIKKEPEQWAKLSSITNYGIKKTEFLRKFSDLCRHGHIISFTDEERKKFFEDTLDIIDAFFENELNVKLK